MISLIKELSFFATEATRIFNKMTATNIAEPSIGSILSVDDALTSGIKSGIYIGHGDIVYCENRKIKKTNVHQFIDGSDDAKVFVACIDAFPAGFPSIAKRAHEFFTHADQSITFKNSDAFVVACIEGNLALSDSDKPCLIEKCERFLLINSWGMWSRPFQYSKAAEPLSAADVSHIQQQIDEKEAFNSVSKVWERSKRSIRKNLSEYTGIIGGLKRELAYINDDYAEYREQVMQDDAKSVDFVDDLYDGVEQEIEMLKAILANQSEH